MLGSIKELRVKCKKCNNDRLFVSVDPKVAKKTARLVMQKKAAEAFYNTWSQVIFICSECGYANPMDEPVKWKKIKG